MPLLGALAGVVVLAGVVAGAGGVFEVAAGGGELCTLPVLEAALSGSGEGPVPTANSAATTETPAAAALTDAMVRSRNRCNLDAPTAAAAARPAAATLAAPTPPAADVAPVTSRGCPKSGDAKTSSRVA